jgi:hypothetical protein
MIETEDTTEDLFTPTDIARVRKQLYEEQKGKCLLTGLDLKINESCLDHKHDAEQLVRGVLYRHSNLALGKLEALEKRFLFWYPEGLPEFLRKAADYLERKEDRRFRHPGFQKKLQTMFNALTASKQNLVLESLGSTTGSNPASRKEKFSKLVKQKDLGFEKIKQAIAKVKEK